MKDNSYISDKERKYQDGIVKLFLNELNYKYLGKLQYAKGAKCLDSGLKNAPIIESELRVFLSSEKYHYTPFQIDEAIRLVTNQSKIADRKKASIQEASHQMYELLTNPIQIQPEADKNHEDVYLFDFDNPLANTFALAEEVSFIDPLTGSHSRPDLVVYVNGIALAVIELKRSIVSFEEGIKQNLSNEIDLIPSFFTTVQYTIAANSNGFRYATLLTPQKFWCPWKRDDHKVGVHLSDEESFREFFAKETFFDLFHYGVINDGGTKKVMRPHQFHALRAAMPRLKAKASGVIWHSQGSGKSLTMVWLAKYIRRNFEDARVLVITDRTELDIQINNTFLGTKEAIHQAKSSDDLLDTLQNGQEWLICSLVHKFGKHLDPVTKKEVEGDDDAPIPLEKYLKELQELLAKKYPGGFHAKGTHKFVFVDECHRTQSGRLHEAMRAIMGDDVMFIGFTGTPLLSADKAKGGYANYTKEKNVSERRFGEFIHKYLHKEAVDDKVILDLQYEARDVEQEISNKEKLDQKLEELLAGVADDNKQSIKDRWATMEKVYSSKERIERIGCSILDDMTQYPLNQDWCNAMLVAGSIYSAYKYYQFFQNDSNTGLRGKCAVVTSYNPTDYDLRKKEDGDDFVQQESKFKNEMAKQSYKDAGVKDADAYEAWAKRLFTKLPSQMKLLIVVDKLLTGFDAPSATYLYIDKDMRDHNLFQAICRVNRLGTDLKEDMDDPDSATIFTHKEFGQIVDFKHLFGNIREAVTNFNDENGGLGGYDNDDIEGLLIDTIDRNKYRLHLAINAFDAMKSDWERQGVKDEDGVVDYFVPDISASLPQDEYDSQRSAAKAKRQAFYKVVQNFVSAYANIADYIIRAGYSEAEAESIHTKVCEARSLYGRVKQAAEEDFDPKEKDPQMRQLLDRFIRADEAESIIPATADFSFLDLLTQDSDTDEAADKATTEAGSAKAAAEKIKAKARAVINDWHSKDKAQSESFAERLQAIIDEMKKTTLETTEAIKKLIELLKSMKEGNKMPEGIKTKFASALYNNRKDWTNETDEAKVIATIIEIEDLMTNKVFGGWKDTTTVAYIKCTRGIAKILGSEATDEHIMEVHRMASANLQD